MLLSGGMDSATCLAVALDGGYGVHTLSFDYGQRHRAELDAAAEVATAFGVAPDRRIVVPLPGVFAASALVRGGAEVPLDRPRQAIGGDIPVTYVPARNLVFLAIATSLAESRDAAVVFIGANALDYSGYPDCRSEFLAAFQEAARLGTASGISGRGVRILAPLLHMGKAEIVRRGSELGVPFERTLSCYLGARPACGRCDACQLRRKGFKEAGLEDPLPYAI